MTVANLRGVRESGSLFAPPTYLYIVMLILLIVVGLLPDLRPGSRSDPAEMPVARRGASWPAGTATLSVLLLLRAFSSGAVALSGVEAVSNGVPAFRRPESRNAATTIAIMGTILGTTFLGVSVLAAHLHPYRGEDDPTGIALMAEWIYDGKGFLFWITQIATFAILILAANTAYADFPRLSSIIARDGFLPRQLANRGDKLVFSNGIIFLALVAGLLVVVFNGNIAALIPLYAFGVFTGFTLSQAGMVVHHFRLREPRWKPSAAINAVGCVATGVVAGVVVVSKFTEGAWIPAALIPAMVLAFRAIARHYRHVRAAVAVESRVHAVAQDPPRRRPGRQRQPRVIEAVQYARSLAPERLIAVSVVATPEEQEAILDAWDEHRMPVPLHTISSPYRELTRPVLDYLDELDEEDPDDVITVVIPEFVTDWKQQWLHNQSALALKVRLLYRPNTVVTSVPVIVNPNEVANP